MWILLSAKDCEVGPSDMPASFLFRFYPWALPHHLRLSVKEPWETGQDVEGTLTPGRAQPAPGERLAPSSPGTNALWGAVICSPPAHPRLHLGSGQAAPLTLLFPGPSYTWAAQGVSRATCRASWHKPSS